ncbi:MAG: hypothetical protein ACQCN6_04540 [Candidatus Bathyarchaeia archaeon]
MNRNKATNLIKEIANACDGLGEEGIMLMPPNADNVLSYGYQLHIKSSYSQQHLDCIQSIVQKHNLALTIEKQKGLIIIYMPREKTTET